jgi:hypothetical protein
VLAPFKLAKGLLAGVEPNPPKLKEAGAPAPKERDWELFWVAPEALGAGKL